MRILRSLYTFQARDLLGQEASVLNRNLHRLKIQRSSFPLTSFAGLPFLLELAHHLGVWDDINTIPGLQERHRRHDPSDYAMSLALTLAAGGDTLDEVELLRQDPGLKKILVDPLAAPNSLGQFLRRFDRSALHRLSLISSGLAVRAIEEKKLSTVTVDIDSTLIEANKELAKMSYNGFPGYNPHLAWIPEVNAWITGVFRDGNASPAAHILPILKRSERLLPPGTRLRFRSDSAGYQIKILRHCHQQNHLFAVRVDQDAAVKEAIASIHPKDWTLVQKGHDTFLLAETVHAPGANRGADLPAFRLIVTRHLTGQLELFKSPLVHHAIITNAPADWTPQQILDFYNHRGSMEKAIGTLKNETGLAQLPCGSLLANAAYFQITLLTYNLLQLFKMVALPLDWQSFGWKKLRFRLFGQAALVVEHARDTILKFAKDYVYFPILERARWAVYAFAPTG